ncbi:GH25 family lysozyme [Rurimicrobium arvi]|uniref:Lysozyme n=1 Tax=Rurimicrobium arvi TaxID=2049916 RepID=A0ABP8MXX0_9BACT
MNFLSKSVLAFLVCLSGALIVLFVKLERNFRAQQTMHATLTGKLDDIKNVFESGRQPSPDLPESHLYGLDISHWDGDIVNEIPALDHISFLICKATQGKSGVDPDFADNWTMIRQKGALRGAYHFYLYADNPVEQAIHFCNTVGPLEQNDIPLVLDVEELSLPREGVNKHKLQEDVDQFLTEVERRIKRKPIIYMDYAFANKYFDDERYAAYPLWLAEYSGSIRPQIPDAWKKAGCMIWQKSDKYNVNSVSTDFDVFEGVEADILNPKSENRTETRLLQYP